MTETTFAPVDQNDWKSEVEMKDGTVYSVLRAPGSTFAQITDAKNAKHLTVTLESVDRSIIVIDPKKVVSVK
jgi:hypothetical protein